MGIIGEWIDSTLHQVIEAYPEYYDYDLYIWDFDGDNSELYFLGAIPQVYKKYKNNFVSFTNENEKTIWLEGTLEDLEN